MDIGQFVDFDEHEQVVLLADRARGMGAIIAVHSTALGPSMGGCRIKPYESAEAAITDALRLSRGMTYKNSLAGIDFGGGKGVIHRFDPTGPRDALMEWFGLGVERLAGRYVTAQDVGASLEDMAAAARVTRHVTGVPGKSDAAGGDPGPWTALGVYLCIEALFGGAVRGKHVTVQGLGSVGGGLAQRLIEAGARVTGADVNEVSAARARALGADIVDTSVIHKLEADLFAPCALGAILNAQSIPELGAPIICGAANNQLAGEGDGAALTARGVVYAPDYLVNAGGIICASEQYLGRGAAAVDARVRQIPERLRTVLDEARTSGAPTHVIADRLAKERVENARKLQQQGIGSHDASQ